MDGRDSKRGSKIIAAEGGILADLFFKKIGQQVLLNLEEQEKFKDPAFKRQMTIKFDKQMQKISKSVKEVNNLNTWSQMPWKQQMQIIDAWTFIIILGNILHMIFVVILLNPYQNYDRRFQNAIFGFAIFLLWIGIIKYLKYSTSLNILPGTVMGVWKAIIKQMLATLPIVFGLGFFMMSYFGS